MHIPGNTPAFRRTCTWTPLILLLAGTLGADPFVQTATVVDGAGGPSTGGPLVHLSAMAQPACVSVATGGNMTHYSGFLNTFLLRPDLDADADGCADELDADNDNDSLTDASEVGGASFDPTTPTDPTRADSDADGTDDAQEALAGTDPWDAGSRLFISALGVADVATVTWQARSNRTYCVARSTNLLDAGGGFIGLDTVTVHAAATGPWFVVTTSYVDSVNTGIPATFYRIELR